MQDGASDTSGTAMQTYVLRVWLPDRPGALGAVASRLGAVGADVVGIEILERGGGQAVDELLIRIPDPSQQQLLLTEVSQVDGVSVEELRPAPGSAGDRHLAALEAATMLATASTEHEAFALLCGHLGEQLEADWVLVADLASGDVAVSVGAPPDMEWVEVFVAGSQASARLVAGEAGPDDVAWAPLPATGLTLVLARRRAPFRARERREVAALARVADARAADLVKWRSRLRHPSNH